MRVQFCCKNFLLRHLLTLKHSHHFNFCLYFHDPCLLCSDGFRLINLRLSSCDHFIFSFSSYYYMKPYSSFFPFVAYLSVSDIYLSDSPPLCCVTLYVPTQSLPVHLTHCVYLDFLTDDPCIFVAYSYSSAFPIEHVTMFLFEA